MQYPVPVEKLTANPDKVSCAFAACEPDPLDIWTEADADAEHYGATDIDISAAALGLEFDAK